MSKAFNENIEPIHELDSDELDHALRKTRKMIEALYMHPNTKPDRKPIEGQVEYNLWTLAHSLKKSLVYLFPQYEKFIMRIVNANEARHFVNSYHEYPLNEGAKALMKIYLMMLNKPFKTNSWDKEDEESFDLEFKEMGSSIERYKMIAQTYYHEDEIAAQPRRSGKRGGSSPKKLVGIQMAMRYALEDLERRHSTILTSITTKTDRESRMDIVDWGDMQGRQSG